MLHHQSQLLTIPRHFYVDLPEELADELIKNSDHAEEIGFNWTLKQCRELLEAGETHLHFFVMSDADSISKLLTKL